jgi:hypothetical protein
MHLHCDVVLAGVVVCNMHGISIDLNPDNCGLPHPALLQDQQVQWQQQRVTYSKPEPVVVFLDGRC